MALLFVRRMTKKAHATPAINASGNFQPWVLPSPTIMAASYECHEELPRWLKMGVETGPLRLCNRRFSRVPPRILSSLRFDWKAWIVLRSPGQYAMRYGIGR